MALSRRFHSCLVTSLHMCGLTQEGLSTYVSQCASVVVGMSAMSVLRYAASECEEERGEVEEERKVKWEYMAPIETPLITSATRKMERMEKERKEEENRYKNEVEELKEDLNNTREREEEYRQQVCWYEEEAKKEAEAVMSGLSLYGDERGVGEERVGGGRGGGGGVWSESDKDSVEAIEMEFTLADGSGGKVTEDSTAGVSSDIDLDAFLLGSTKSGGSSGNGGGEDGRREGLNRPAGGSGGQHERRTEGGYSGREREGKIMRVESSRQGMVNVSTMHTVQAEKGEMRGENPVDMESLLDMSGVQQQRGGGEEKGMTASAVASLIDMDVGESQSGGVTKKSEQNRSEKKGSGEVQMREEEEVVTPAVPEILSSFTPRVEPKLVFPPFSTALEALKVRCEKAEEEREAVRKLLDFVVTKAKNMAAENLRLKAAFV
uniref:Uncharacterized protein n=1 Tax=Palpitomonas bilix TaxID=652834 RepID=A0A7S3LXM5_9EUKA